MNVIIDRIDGTYLLVFYIILSFVNHTSFELIRSFQFLRSGFLRNRRFFEKYFFDMISKAGQVERLKKSLIFDYGALCFWAILYIPKTGLSRDGGRAEEVNGTSSITK